MNTIEYDINNVQICETFRTRKDDINKVQRRRKHKVKPLVIEAFDKDNNRHIDIHL